MLNNNTISAYTTSDIPCNLCGSFSVSILSFKDRNRDHLKTVICKKCGLIWSDSRPDKGKIKHFYSKKYRQEYKQIVRPKKKHIYRAAIRAMKRYDLFKNLIQPGFSVLDIGAGTGVFVYFLRSLGLNVQGIEPDQNYARYAREVLGVPVTTAFFEDIDDDRLFDIITIFHVLEHMVSPIDEVIKMVSLLQKDGYLVIEVPNAENTKQDPHNRYHKAHIYTFNPETLICLCEKAGLTLYRISVEPSNGNIFAIFQKEGRPAICTKDLNMNHDNIMHILNQHNSFNHFVSVVPYKKLINNIIYSIREQLETRKYREDKEIIDAFVTASQKAALPPQDNP